MNLVLIGYRCVGKSTVAGLLGERLGRAVAHTDARVERRVGLTISELVARSGWDRFRAIEREVVREVATLEDAIIDTGGGVVLDPANVEALRARGRLVWLTAPAERIVERLAASDDRPSLTAEGDAASEARRVLAEREPLYRAAADHVVDTDGLDPEAVAERVAALLDAPDPAPRAL